jgi:hypothetical protein
MSYRRKQQEKQKHKKLYEETKNKYGKGLWYDPRKERFIVVSMSDNTKRVRYLKRQCNKAVRRRKGIYNRKTYRKLNEYWWVLV